MQYVLDRPDEVAVEPFSPVRENWTTGTQRVPSADKECPPYSLDGRLLEAHGALHWVSSSDAANCANIYPCSSIATYTRPETYQGSSGWDLLASCSHKYLIS